MIDWKIKIPQYTGSTSNAIAAAQVEASRRVAEELDKLNKQFEAILDHAMSRPDIEDLERTKPGGTI